MKKRISVLFVLMLLFQTISSSMIGPLTIDAEGSEQSVFTDLYITDEDGNQLAEENLSEDSTVLVNVEWTVEDVEVEDGVTYAIDLNDSLSIKDEQEGFLIIEDREESLKVGTFNVATDGQLTARFTEAITEHPDAGGTIVVDAHIGAEDNTEQTETNEESEDTEQTNEKDSVLEEEVKDPVEKAIQTDEEKHGFNLELGEVTDIEGNPFTEDNLLDPQDEFRLKMEWTLEDGHNYVAGETETFDLPKGIKINQGFDGELRDATGQLVANYEVTTDKQVILTFTDFVETHSNVKGWLQIVSMLDEEEVEVEDGKAILDPIGEEDELRIPIEEGSKEKTIEKKGTPNKGYNADEIHWEVIINKHKTSLENATVTDILPEGTEYKEGSLKVTKLRVDIYGNVLGDEEEIEVTGETFENGELTIPLGDTNDAYRIEYDTTVTDDEEQSFKNKATLKDSELEDVQADATVYINRGEAIKKKAAKGYDPKTGIIEWEIEFNYNEKDLVDVLLTDAWTPAGKLDLVEDSLVFTEMEIDENGHAHETGNVGLPEGSELIPGEDGFEVSGITTDKPYKVTYQTKVTDRVLDPFDVANTAGFGNESDGSGTHVGQYYGSKSAGPIDYSAKTIDWTIEINHDEFPMENISIVDTLGEGLILLEDTIEITVDGQAYEGDYTLLGDNPFTIEFPEEFTTDKRVVITYQTEFDADRVPDQKPTNKANIIWTPEGGNEQIEKEVEAETELNWETIESSWKNGSYNPETKEITWTIYVNYRENEIDHLIIDDAPEGNQKIVSDSVVVKELLIDEHGNITEGEALDSDVVAVDEDDNTLQVTIGPTNKSYKVEYQTSLAGLSDIQKEYVNEAEVKDGDEVISELKAEVGIVKSNTYGEKSGEQEGKQVHWTIGVNLGQQQVTNLTLEDSISENQEYLEDTITVYHATIDGNGNASKGDEVSSDEYELQVDQESGEFTIEWNDEVERAFIVVYSTLFFAGHGEDVTNNYKVTGDNIIEDGHTDGEGKVSIVQWGSGGGTGEAGYLIIDKVDVTDGREETKLAGAEFDLIDADTGNVLKSGTTDDDGQIDFGRLLFGNYELYERVVPEGFVTPDERQIIVIDQKYEPGDDKESFEYTVENYEPVFAIELFKTDDADNALADAEFTLFDSDDNEIATKTTNEEGKILFEDLQESGTYYVQETEAPAGYVLDETKHKVTVGEKEREPVTLTLENTPRGTVQLTKTDKDTNEPLEGVLFELQKLTDSGESELVETYTTDADGMIETENTLEAGEYQFVEKEALDGYRTNEEEIKFTVELDDPKTHTFTMTNEKQKGSIKLIKEDAATGDLLAGAQFKLVDSEGEGVQENLETNDQGEIVIDNLLLGTYQLIETEAPEGYELDETPIEVEITEDLKVVEKTATNHKLTNISVEKHWNNNGGETTPVTVKLLPTEDTLELNDENNWQGIFTDLRVYDDSGEEIDYEVVELDVEGYESEVIGDATEGFTIINTQLMSISGTKTWLDGDSEERPESITVELLANGTKVNEVEVNKDSDWTFKFNDLVKYDAEGEEIAYTIEEVKVDGYETTIDGFDITNLRVGTTEVSGTKTWLDDDSEERPESITVELLASGEETGQTVDVSEASNWEYAFTDLPKYDEGVEIIYTVEEEAVEGYETSVDGYDLTNLRVGITEVDITKLWKDEDETDRPETIQVNLLQNGEFYDEYEITAENSWELTITALPKYDNEGKAYEYRVTEHDVPGYAADIDGFEITNTRADVKTIEITKTWLDDDSEDRPDSIEVELYRSVVNGEKELVDTITITAEDGWSLEVTDLPAFDQDGKAYTYEIEEKAVEGYETTINGFDITNLRIGKTEVSGTKIWLDDESEDRPDSITVKLYANGEETGQTVDVSEASNWEYAFTDLPKYDDEGVEIIYTVEEEAVEGYETSIDGYDITNLRVGETEITGTKTWVDDDLGDRPDFITVNLLANGKKTDQTVEVTEASNWEYAFTNLPKYDDEGIEIIYTVEEDPVFGYESVVDGFDIINTLIHGSVELTKYGEGEKVLEGAVFTLLDAEGNTLLEGLTTDENGKLFVDNLKPGDYYFVETEAPNGYELDETPIAFTIDKGQEEITKVAAYNEKTPEPSVPTDKPEDPQTDDNKIPKTATQNYNMILGGLLTFLSGGLTLLFYRNRRRVE